MRKLGEFGLTADDLLGPLPELSALAEAAVRCWQFCDGWAPERWPVFAAFHDVPDWAGMVELMQHLRDQVRRHG